MKLTIWEPKLPTSAIEMKEEFARKLGAFRAATGKPERFLMRCTCAVHDKGFTVVYERHAPDARFVLNGIYKDGESVEAGDASAGKSRTLRASEVDHAGWRCPYCESGQQISCDQCHTTVCGGKTRRYPGTRDVFTCRVSCGARGTLVDAITMHGREPVRSAAAGPVAPKQTLIAPSHRLGASTGTPRLK